MKRSEIRVCSFVGCGRPVVSKALCSTHYGQYHCGRQLKAIKEAAAIKPLTPTQQSVAEWFFPQIKKLIHHPKLKRYARHYYDFNDAVAVASVAVVRAAREYDSTIAIFSTFAFACIGRELKLGLRLYRANLACQGKWEPNALYVGSQTDCNATPRWYEDRSDDNNRELQESLYAKLATDDSHRIDTADETDELMKHMQTLTKREMDILSLRYFGGLAISEISKRLGISKARVYQIQAKALQKIRDKIGKCAGRA